MTDAEHNAVARLESKLDALVEDLAAMKVGLAKISGRLEGGWWVLAALGTISAVIGGWFLALYGKIHA
jgi:hypothetical protein